MVMSLLSFIPTLKHFESAHSVGLGLQLLSGEENKTPEIAMFALADLFVSSMESFPNSTSVYY